MNKQLYVTNILSHNKFIRQALILLSLPIFWFLTLNHSLAQDTNKTKSLNKSEIQPTNAQNKPKKIKLLNAEELIYDEESNKDIRKLLGNVRFKHEDVLMYCDSAYLFTLENKLYAYSNVRIIRGDSLELTGDSLKYYGDTKFAELRGDITATTPTQQLITSYLDYDIGNNIVYYAGGGVITDTENNQTLRSERGTYVVNESTYYFKTNVDIQDSNFRIVSDTLQYNTSTELATFFGPTHIYDDSTDIYCESGFYDRLNKKSVFTKNAYIQDKEQILRGDSILYDQNVGFGEFFNNVSIEDTINKVTVAGDYGYYNEVDSSSMVTGHTLMTQIFTDDTLYLHADTLLAFNDSLSKKAIAAYHHVQFYKPDLQGKCDSLTMYQGDSLLKMFHDPVLWNGASQITGEHIFIKTYDGIIEKMYIDEDALIISKNDTAPEADTVYDFNQIQGRELTAFFRDNEIFKINVEGNGQTIYYAEEEDGSVFGLNRLDCSNMTLYLVESKIKDIRFYVKPSGVLHPLKELTNDIRYFRYFKWREGEQPKAMEDIFNWKPTTEGMGIPIVN